MRVLIVEYLHAQSEAYRLGSASMRDEGRLMLESLLKDVVRIDGALATVALCQAATTDVTTEHILEVADGPEFDFAEQLLKACEHLHFEKVVVIAPEGGGILSQIVRRIRHKGMEVLAPSLHSIAVCADKLATFQFLERLRIPCIPTRLLSKFAELEVGLDQQIVIKPRDGSGCELVKRMHASEMQSKLIPEHRLHFTERMDLAVQPYVEGDFYSVGVIGLGLESKPHVLPLATQEIEWNGKRPAYCGGTIQGNPASEVSQNLQSIAVTIADALNIDSGYLGIDFVIQQDTGEALVVEINPRLCTSYVGYRKATSGNLAEVILQSRTSEVIVWDRTPVNFNVPASS